MLICPVCRDKLTRLTNTFQCVQGHSYDIARDGYVNLLLSNQKASQAPGDSKEMLLSRREFLDKGYYEPLSDHLNQSVSQLLSAKGEQAMRTLLDAGCGEGYYLNRLQHSLKITDLTGEIQSFGVDISKDAIQLGAKKYKDSLFVGASIQRLIPFEDGAIDVLLSIFAPRNVSEFERILSKNGHVVVVVPASDHMGNLFDALELPRLATNKEQTLDSTLNASFEIQAEEIVRYSRYLESEDILRLINMTPVGWHLSDDVWTIARNIPSLTVEFAFTILVLARKPSSCYETLI